jgi:hypothetical protein
MQRKYMIDETIKFRGLNARLCGYRISRAPMHKVLAFLKHTTAIREHAHDSVTLLLLLMLHKTARTLDYFRCCLVKSTPEHYGCR